MNLRPSHLTNFGAFGRAFGSAFCRPFGRAGGDRTHDRGIMRWLQTVGMVRLGRIHLDLKENLSGGVGFVRLCRIGLWDETWDLATNFNAEIDRRTRVVATNRLGSHE